MLYKKQIFLHSKEVKEIIQNILPPSAQILCLALTGSRAWGGAKDNSDFDIVGLYFFNGYWDSVQLYKNNFDIDLYQFKHPFLYKRFYLFVALSNYFYVNPKFEIENFLKFGAFGSIKGYQNEIISWMQFFKMSHFQKDAMHAYESLLTPIYFFKKNKLTLDVNIINKNLNLNLKGLRQLYINKKDKYEERISDLNAKIIEKELDMLFNMYLELINKFQINSNFNIANVQKWFDKEYKKFY